MAHQRTPDSEKALSRREDRLERLTEIHLEGLDYLEGSWMIMIGALKSCPNLKSLSIDIADLYCPMGCCRTNIVKTLFEKYMVPVRHDVDVSVSGIYPGKEHGPDEERESLLVWRIHGLSEKEKDEAIKRMTVKEHCYIGLDG